MGAAECRRREEDESGGKEIATVESAESEDGQFNSCPSLIVVKSEDAKSDTEVEARALEIILRVVETV
jgi:hypothetical protein